MSLTDKLNAVQAILRDFFTATGQEDTSDGMIDDLKKAGAVNESFAAEMEVDDVLHAISVPMPVARKIVKALGNDKSEAEKQIVVVCDDPVTMALRMTNRQLVEAYDPDEPDSPVAQRLLQKVGGATSVRPFLVWDDDAGTILVDASVECLEDLVHNFPSRTTMNVNGVMRPVLPLGVRPNVWADENPVVEGEVLRRDGTSAKNVPWGDIPLDVRKLLRVAMKNVSPAELVIASTTERDIYRQVAGKNVQEVGQDYPNAAVLLKQLKGGNNEPKLRIQLKGGTAAASGTK
jgi:hypothetical protein